MSKELEPQTDLTPGKKNVYPKVLQFITEREAQACERYGQPLRTHCGRDPLADALQEAIDCVFYLTQAIMERDEEEDDPIQGFNTSPIEDPTLF